MLPHCVHLLSWGGRHRWDALRVRRRIFEVLRLGTPIRGIRKAGFPPKATSTPALARDLARDLSCKIRSKIKIRSRSFQLQFQLIQRTPVWRAFAFFLSDWFRRGRSGADAPSLAIAMGMRRQVQQDILAQIWGEID